MRLIWTVLQSILLTQNIFSASWNAFLLSFYSMHFFVISAELWHRTSRVCQQGSSYWATSDPSTKDLNIEWIEMNPLNMIVRNVRNSILISQWVCKWSDHHTFIHLNCNERAFKMSFEAISSVVWCITDLQRIRWRLVLLNIFILHNTHEFHIIWNIVAN